MEIANRKNIANWFSGNISKYLNENKNTIADTKLTPKALAELIEQVEKNVISNTAAKTVLEVILKEEKAVSDIIAEKGLSQISDSSALEQVVSEVMAANEKSINDYRNGKTNALGFLVGQCMKATKGKGNPAMLKE